LRSDTFSACPSTGRNSKRSKSLVTLMRDSTAPVEVHARKKPAPFCSPIAHAARKTAVGRVGGDGTTGGDGGMQATWL